MVELHDTLILDGKARRLRTGELAASVRCARTGLQDYAGHEVERPELDRVTVYRPETEVMKRDSFATFAGVPVTIDHPKEAVTTDNWKRYAVGESGDEVVRDGEFIRVPILVRDENAIRAIQDGKRQISMGYSCSLEFVDGVAPDGRPYQAIQRDIKVNHLAVVDRARGGEALVVEDQRSDGQTYTDHDVGDKKARQRRETVDKGVGQVATETMQFDGMPIEVTDQGKAAILKLQGQLADSATKLTAADQALKDEQTKVVERDATIVSKDEKIAELETKLTDAAITPAKLQDAAKDYADVCGKAQALGVTFAEDADADAVKKAVVDAKMGDAAKDYDPAHIAIAFDALTKDAKVDPLRQVIGAGVKPNIVGRQAVDTARKAWLNDKAGAYRKPVAQGAK